MKFSKMNTQTFDLNKMGLAPMDSSEMQEVEGGSLLTDAFKALVMDYAVQGAKYLIGQVAADWNSRSGGAASITARTAGGYYN